MAEIGLGFPGKEDEVRGDRRRKKGGRLSLKRGSRRRGRARDGSAVESCFYSGDYSGDGSSLHDEALLFASAPGSFGGRCSFGSDLSALSHSPCSSLTQLAGCGSSYAQGLDPELETTAPSSSTNANISSTKSNALSASKELVLDEVLPEEHLQVERNINSSIQQVSYNLREESHNDMDAVEALPSPSRQHRRRRPGSLDLNASSAYVKNSFAPPNLQIRSNIFPSPGTPNYWHGGVGVANYPKGWSSERVPLPASRGQKYGVNAPFFPFNNGRTMPSKWEDAERWICSPVSGDGSRRPLMLPPYHRRPKSKSGPLGAPSPRIPCFDNGKVVNFAGTSPLLAGVLVTDQQLCVGAGGESYELEDHDCSEQFFTANLEGYTDQSTSMHGWLDMLMEPCTSLPSSDGALQATMTSAMILRRDVGTQMSPEGSTHSSPKERTSISHSQPSTCTVTELQSHSPCLDIRDVQVDDRVTVTRWSKKHISRCSDRRSTEIIDWTRRTLESPASSWKIVDTEKRISKYDREEAKITAWENLQKAKAEAALRKLEMKLEKKRSSSMEKILKKLKSSQKKAQNMRNSAVDRQSHLVPRTRKRALNLGKYCSCSLRCCFDTRAV
ncbi:Remorin [Apostasia shenzhenica]|uniref:Remorin n=1 Tax=Apostasia shenzhenica TaxID=1088818 RepID=A0A2I0A0R9_9ASPA|nr:Remorin [Apostasia shenzhenica]